MQSFNAEVAFKIPCILGEGPVWSRHQDKLYWVDIEKMEVHALHADNYDHQVWKLHERTGFAIPVNDEQLVIGQHRSVALLDTRTGNADKLFTLPDEAQNNRCNDGKCDKHGRLWFGTMDVDCKPGLGNLYCVGANLKPQRVLSNLTIANGMGWSLDDREMYFIDSPDRMIKKSAYDLTNPSFQVIQEFKITDSPSEQPDGMCVDAEGMLWVAVWGGSRIVRLNPTDGKQVAVIHLPAPYVTSCTFGGANLDTLFITTSREGLTQEQLRDYPLSGSIFSCNPGVKGLPANNFLMKSASIA